VSCICKSVDVLFTHFCVTTCHARLVSSSLQHFQYNRDFTWDKTNLGNVVKSDIAAKMLQLRRMWEYAKSDYVNKEQIAAHVADKIGMTKEQKETLR
jgi:hypothetical protein